LTVQEAVQDRGATHAVCQRQKHCFKNGSRDCETKKFCEEFITSVLRQMIVTNYMLSAAGSVN